MSFSVDVTIERKGSGLTNDARDSADSYFSNYGRLGVSRPTRNSRLARGVSKGPGRSGNAGNSPDY